MISNKIPTRFASAERTDPKSLLGQNQHFSNFDLLCQILDSVPNGVVILNAERQIVFLNQTMLTFSANQQRGSPGDAYWRGHRLPACI